MKSRNAKYMIERIIRLCEGNTAKREFYELFFNEYGEFADNESYWIIAYRAQKSLEERPKTILKKERCIITEKLPLDILVPFDLQESYISYFDEEQRKEVGISIDRVSIYEGRKGKFLNINGKLKAGLSIDCELDIVAVGRKNRKLAAYEYVKLVAEDKGTYIVDVLLPLEKKTLENICKAYIFCRYR